MVAPQAQAADNKAERVADAAARKAEALEAQMEQMNSMMQQMQAELSRVKSAAAKDTTETAKIQELISGWLLLKLLRPRPALKTTWLRCAAVGLVWINPEKQALISRELS